MRKENTPEHAPNTFDGDREKPVEKKKGERVTKIVNFRVKGREKAPYKNQVGLCADQEEGKKQKKGRSRSLPPKRLDIRWV